VQQKTILPPQMVLLRQLGFSLRHSLDFPQLCKTVVDILRAESGAENCSLYLVAGWHADKIVLRAAMGRQDELPAFFPDVDEPVQAGRYFRAGTGVLGRAAAEQRPLLVADAGRSRDFLPLPSSPVDIGSLLSVPLIAADRLLGVLNLSHPETDRFDSSLLTVMESVADLVALALARHQPLLASGRPELGETGERGEEDRFLVANSPDGMVIVRGGRLVYANAAFRQLVAQDEVVGRPATDFIACQEMGCQACEHPAVVGGADICFETTLRRPDRLPLPVEITGCRLAGGGEGEETICLYCRDVSSRAQLEKIKDVFFASLVHELKNPITVIHSYLQLLAGHGAGFGSQEHKLLDDMRTATRRLMKLLQDIMSYSRLNCVEQALQLKEWQLNDEIENTVKFFQPLLGEKNITIRLELQPDLEPFPFDREKINQVLVNLLDNAVKFTPRGGMITVGSRVTTEEMAAEQSYLGCDLNAAGGGSCQRFVEVWVADTGIGLPADKELVFNEFYTAGNSAGTGLGLPICRRIINCHHGKITAASNGQGSIFTFSLPMDNAAVAATGMLSR